MSVVRGKMEATRFVFKSWMIYVVN
jgi:hypothetical protein